MVNLETSMCTEIIHAYTARKLTAPKSKIKPHPFADARDHNTIDTLHLVWAVTSEQMNIKIKILSSGYLASLLWFVANSTLKNMDFIHLEKIFYSKIAWVDAMSARSQFKTTKPNLWQIKLIPYALRQLPQCPCFDIFLFQCTNFMMFLAKKHEINSHKRQIIFVWGFYRAPGKLASDLTYMTSYFGGKHNFQQS